MVFVLDQKKRPLMPCTRHPGAAPAGAWAGGGPGGAAVCHPPQKRRVEDSVLQPIALKSDPGSKPTGLALARAKATEEGELRNALFLSEVQHRGQTVHDQKVTQANARRRQRRFR